MIVDATQFAGNNIFEKIVTAYNNAALPATGGVIDARGHTGDQTISGTLTIGTGPSTKPCLILLPAGDFAFTDNSSAPKIRIRGAGIRLVGVAQGFRAFTAPSTTLRQSYTLNAPLIEVSADSGDSRGPQHIELEYLDLVGADAAGNGGPAIVLKAGQFCRIQKLVVQKFKRSGVPAIQLTTGPTGSATLGCVFCTVADLRIIECAGGVEISGGGNLATSSNANWVQRCVGASLSGPALSIRNYAVGNSLVDCETEANSGANDVLISGIADGTRVDRLYTESDSLTGPSLLITSDASVREGWDTTIGSPASQGNGVAAIVSVEGCTFSRSSLGSNTKAIEITHARSAGDPGPQGTVIRDCFIKQFVVGISIAKAEINGSYVGQSKFSLCTTNIADSGTATTLWNYPGDLHLAGQCRVLSSSDAALEVVNGRIRITSNNKGLDGVTSLGAIRQIIKVNASNEIELSPDGFDVRWGRALVGLGGGATAALGAVGGSGPVNTAQNSWMQVVDSSGNKFWVPVWK